MSSNAKGAAKSVIRRRISRACDQCNQLRTRCDGLNPCAHCISFNLECKYARERKKRGKASKKDLLLQQQKLQQQQQSQNNQPENQKQNQPQQPLQSQPQQQQSLQPTRISQARKRKRAATIAEVSTEGQFDGKGLDTVMRPMKRNSAVQSSPTPKSPFNYAQPGSHDMRAFSLQQQHANLNIQHGDGMHTFAASAMQPVPVELASLITPQTENPPSLTESYMIFNTQNQQNLELSPSHAYPLPESHHTWLAATDIPQESHNTLRYPVLLPLLPHISDIMSEDEACDMLDLYFSQPGLLYPTSPYVLTQVIKKESVLHPTTPRTTSAALLASILCIACQTNPNLDEHAGRVDANGRGIMSQKLLGLCIELLRPLVHCSSQPTPDLNSDGVAYGLVSPWPTDCRKDDASSDGSTATLDDVLTYINLALMWSGSDMKHVSLRWWTSAWNLARELRLNREPTAEEGKNVCHSPTDLEPQLITEEVREERRRAWWLLYMVDRQMALCYNRPLAFLDVEAVGMYLPDEGCAGNFSNTSEQVHYQNGSIFPVPFYHQ